MDLEIKLIDEHNSNLFITVDCNREILYKKCSFFSALANFNEKDKNKIDVRIPNIYVAKDILLGLHEQPLIYKNNMEKWKYELESIKCKFYLNLSVDLQIICNRAKLFIVPSEGFELLLEVGELLGATEEIMNVVINNIPRNFDMTKFPKEILNEMSNVVGDYDIVVGLIRSHEGDIFIYNGKTGNIVKTLGVKHVFYMDDFYYPAGEKKLFSMYRDTIKAWDMVDRYLLVKAFNRDFNNTGDAEHITSLCHLPTNRRLVSGDSYGVVKVWNIDNFKLVNKFNNDDITLCANTLFPIKLVCNSSKENYLAIYNSGNQVRIWDMENWNRLAEYQLDYPIIDLSFALNDTQIIVVSEKNIGVLEFQSKKISLYSIGENNKIYRVTFSPNRKYLCLVCECTNTEKKSVLIWDIKNRTVDKKLNMEIETMDCDACKIRHSNENKINISYSPCGNELIVISKTSEKLVDVAMYEGCRCSIIAKIFDTKTGEYVREFNLSKEYVENYPVKGPVSWTPGIFCASYVRNVFCNSIFNHSAINKIRTSLEMLNSE